MRGLSGSSQSILQSASMASHPALPPFFEAPNPTLAIAHHSVLLILTSLVPCLAFLHGKGSPVHPQPIAYGTPNQVYISDAARRTRCVNVRQCCSCYSFRLAARFTHADYYAHTRYGMGRSCS
ncbi:hypothetical protein BJX64DRAFT_195403 [Aspergillus heterothallicus]